jgi:hypothetical protein
MSHILFDLPPLSPDYSGIASVFHDIGALSILHDASGCTGTYTGYDEPRWFGSSSPTFCSGLREMDAVLGEDGKLLEKIKSALRYIPAPCVAVIGSPVPMLIGFDFTGFALLVERQTGLPAFGFSSNGMRYYDRGQRDAYLAIAKRVVKGEARRLPGTVNILGASVQDGFDGEALDYMEDMLTGAGFKRLTVWGQRSSWLELPEAPCAECNWVISAAALPLARLFEECYGIPFVAGLPIGSVERNRILSAITDCHEGKKPRSVFPPAGIQSGLLGQQPEILIAGEALFCSSLRAYLEREAACGTVCTGTFFDQGKELLRSGDYLFTSEDDARQVLSAPWIKWILADPLFRELTGAESPARFTPIPHRAISGRLYNESRRVYFDAPPL